MGADWAVSFGINQLGLVTYGKTEHYMLGKLPVDVRYLVASRASAGEI